MFTTRRKEETKINSLLIVQKKKKGRKNNEQFDDDCLEEEMKRIYLVAMAMAGIFWLLIYIEWSLSNWSIISIQFLKLPLKKFCFKILSWYNIIAC